MFGNSTDDCFVNNFFKLKKHLFHVSKGTHLYYVISNFEDFRQPTTLISHVIKVIISKRNLNNLPTLIIFSNQRRIRFALSFKMSHKTKKVFFLNGKNKEKLEPKEELKCKCQFYVHLSTIVKFLLLVANESSIWYHD